MWIQFRISIAILVTFAGAHAQELERVRRGRHGKCVSTLHSKRQKVVAVNVLAPQRLSETKCLHYSLCKSKFRAFASKLDQCPLLKDQNKSKTQLPIGNDCKGRLHNHLQIEASCVRPSSSHLLPQLYSYCFFILSRRGTQIACIVFVCFQIRQAKRVLVSSQKSLIKLELLF